jgi:DNA-binding PadR family transcriptional regulator
VDASRVELVTLGLLAEEPQHGYELWERYRARGMAWWAPAGRASVYQALRRLETAALGQGRDEEGEEGPDRRVYRITRPGRDALRRGLLAGFEATAPSGSPASLALGMAHLVSARGGKERRRRAGAGDPGHARLLDVRS